jgi:endogenous inhibitor of DNA gyrase (YacG/DUF329 family)
MVTDKITRDAELIAFHMKNPCLTLEQIGHKFGITRQRVDQILLSVDIHIGKRRKTRPLCLNCGKPCKRMKAVYCSVKCFNEQHRLTLICHTCGKTITRSQSAVLRTETNPEYTEKKFYCSNRCKGANIGKTYGFTAHPENISKVCRFQKKHDHVSIIEEYKISKLSKTEFAKSKEIPVSTIYGILKGVTC